MPVLPSRLYAGLTRNSLTMGGVALGWETIVHHVAIHAAFHIVFRFVLKIGGRLMNKVTKMVKSMTNVSVKLISEVKELSLLALVSAASSIQRPRQCPGPFCIYGLKTS